MVSIDTYKRELQNKEANEKWIDNFKHQEEVWEISFED